MVARESDVAAFWASAPRWELGDEFVLARGRWVRRVRVVGVTDTGPSTHEYTLREIDHGRQVEEGGAEGVEGVDPHSLVWAYAAGQQEAGQAEVAVQGGPGGEAGVSLAGFTGAPWSDAEFDRVWGDGAVGVADGGRSGGGVGDGCVGGPGVVEGPGR